MWRKVEEMGQKWILEPLFSEIRVILHNYTLIFPIIETRV